MRTGLISLFFAAMWLCLFHGVRDSPAEDARLEVGAASMDITPPLRMPMAGYFHERLATGIHDPLHAKAIYVRGGAVEFLWIFCDLIALDRETVVEARESIRRRLSVPEENILIAATHAHTGPQYYRSPEGRSSARSGLSSMQREYIEALVENIAESAQRAKASAKATTVCSSSCPETTLSFNRRFHMKSGEVRFNPGRGNPEIVRPAGPIDPEVSVLSFRPAEGGDPFAVLVGFALHLDTVGGTRFSSDYPYFMGEKLRAKLSPKTLPIFAQGTAGDINHIDVKNPDQVRGIKGTQLMGEKLADDVLKAIETERRVEPVPVGVASKVVPVPLQTVTPEDVKQAREVVEKRERPFLELVRAHKILALTRINRDVLGVEIQVFRIGDVALVGLPGEVFVELGLSIKKKSPFATTMVVELANDSIHYVPTRKAFSEGSYETVNSIIAPGGGELMVETALALLQRLQGK
jgi:neutral ceramidase